MMEKTLLLIFLLFLVPFVAGQVNVGQVPTDFSGVVIEANALTGGTVVGNGTFNQTLTDLLYLRLDGGNDGSLQDIESLNDINATQFSAYSYCATNSPATCWFYNMGSAGWQLNVAGTTKILAQQSTIFLFNNTQVSGNVTAERFIGSGASLYDVNWSKTNIAFTNESNTFTKNQIVNGNVTAERFIGNGSSLTSVCLSNGSNCQASAGTFNSTNIAYVNNTNHFINFNDFNDTLQINTTGKLFFPDSGLSSLDFTINKPSSGVVLFNGSNNNMKFEGGSFDLQSASGSPIFNFKAGPSGTPSALTFNDNAGTLPDMWTTGNGFSTPYIFFCQNFLISICSQYNVSIQEFDGGFQSGYVTANTNYFNLTAVNHINFMANKLNYNGNEVCTSGNGLCNGTVSETPDHISITTISPSVMISDGGWRNPFNSGNYSSFAYVNNSVHNITYNPTSGGFTINNDGFYSIEFSLPTAPQFTSIEYNVTIKVDGVIINKALRSYDHTSEIYDTRASMLYELAQGEEVKFELRHSGIGTTGNIAGRYGATANIHQI